jgi:uncharacterized protein
VVAAPTVRDNPDELRYEAWVGDRLAGTIRYTLDGDTITLVHTEVEPEFEGHGVGNELVRQALDTERARGRKVRPLCPFVAAFIRRHPDYAP